jgi:hypothetical protein
MAAIVKAPVLTGPNVPFAISEVSGPFAGVVKE